jgi:hypothetical protein
MHNLHLFDYVPQKYIILFRERLLMGPLANLWRGLGRGVVCYHEIILFNVVALL